MSYVPAFPLVLPLPPNFVKIELVKQLFSVNQKFVSDPRKTNMQNSTLLLPEMAVLQTNEQNTYITQCSQNYKLLKVSFIVKQQNKLFLTPRWKDHHMHWGETSFPIIYRTRCDFPDLLKQPCLERPEGTKSDASSLVMMPLNHHCHSCWPVTST